MASQTLLQQLGGAFWQAFTSTAGTTETTLDACVPTWDAEKIRRVLEGRAVVRVVDVEAEEKTTLDDTTTQESSSKECPVLEESMCALSLDRK
jgi:bZIP-type transcription factor MBZ1